MKNAIEALIAEMAVDQFGANPVQPQQISEFVLQVIDDLVARDIIRIAAQPASSDTPEAAERSDDEAINKAWQLEGEVRKLFDRVNSLLDPIAKKAMKASDAEIESLVRQLPSGFHRTELMTELNRRRSS